LIASAIVASLGGLLFGMETAVISGANDWLRLHFALTPFRRGFTVASALIGTIVGSIAVGRMADALGRRSVLILLATKGVSLEQIQKRLGIE
jgi:MFS family permease